MSSSINMNKCWYHQLIFMILCIENVLRSCNPEIKTFFSFSLCLCFFFEKWGCVAELKHFSIFAILFHFVMHCFHYVLCVRCIQSESAQTSWQRAKNQIFIASHSTRGRAVSRSHSLATYLSIYLHSFSF